VEPGHDSEYRLVAATRSGEERIFGPVRVSVAPGPAAARAFPNPLRGATTIRFPVPAEGAAVLEVFDVSGRRIDRRETARVAPGAGEIVWPGNTSSGDRAPSGSYFYRVSQGGRVLASARIVIAR
jgi:hypothetical protein